MKLSFRASTLILVTILVGSQAIGCGGDSENGGRRPIPIATDPSGTPVEFERFRDGLADQLDAIGPNIGAVPSDVQRQLLKECGQLTNFVGEDDVAPLCRAIRQAMDNSDPGLIENVVRLMRELEAG